MAKKNAPVEAQVVPAGYVPALKKVYKEEIVEKLTKQFSYTTVMQVPRLVKITINEGVGDATQDKKIVEEAAEVWMAAEYQSDDELAEEISQLMYWTQVVMVQRGLTPEDVYKYL